MTISYGPKLPKQDAPNPNIHWISAMLIHLFGHRSG